MCLQHCKKVLKSHTLFLFFSQLDTSFLQDELLDFPQLAADDLLTIDSASDVFPDFDLYTNDGEIPFGLEDVFAPNGASPTTSESENIAAAGGGDAPGAAESHGTDFPTSSGGSGGAATTTTTNIAALEGEDDAKRLARMQRNRENAYLSRQRKKQQMFELHQTCTQLRGHNTNLTAFIQRLVAENCLLRHHLGVVCVKAGVAMPDVPSVMKPTTTTTSPAVGGTNGTTNGTAAGVGMAMRPLVPGMLPTANVQQQQQQQQLGNNNLNINRAPQQQTTAQQAPPSAPAPTSSRPVRSKRSRTTTGAGAAFLALFSVFLFVGPFVPGTSLSGRPLDTATPISHSAGYLPAASILNSGGGGGAVLEPLSRSTGGGGRALQAAATIDDDGGDTTTTSSSTPPHVLTSASIVNETLEALLRDPSSQTASIQLKALQRLQELAPAAVLLDPSSTTDTDSHSAEDKNNPLAAVTAFPTLAGHFFKAAGLDAPQTCRKVFEFEAATLPHPLRSRASVERFITGAYGFKGRSIGLLGTSTRNSVTTVTPLQLPSAAAVQRGTNSDSPLVILGEGESESVLRIEDDNDDNDDDHQEEEVADVDDDGGGDEGEQLPLAVSEPTLVSVLLPANASHPGEGKLSAVDRVFVVLLHPGDKFVTYSCGLSRPMLM